MSAADGTYCGLYPSPIQRAGSPRGGKENTMIAEKKTTPAKRSFDRRSTEVKTAVASAWLPQPNPLTREEIRKIVMEQIG